MNSKIKLLIFPAEAENAFEAFHALRFSTRFEVWGASKEAGYGNILFKKYKDNLPSIKDEHFIEELNLFLEEKNISLILPTHDDVALFLAKNSNLIKSKIIGSSEKCAELCRDKKKFYEKLKESYFCPMIFSSYAEITSWPVFIKPRKGQGSINCRKVNSTEELLKNINDDYIVSEYLPGEEITVDCFTDNFGKLIFIGPRSRDVVKIGISFSSQTLELDSKVEIIANEVNDLIKPNGLWFFQLKKDRFGEFKILEASCRVSSSMSIYRQAGVNLPLLAAYNSIGMPIKAPSVETKIVMKRRLYSSYITNISYNSVYVDYDDTLIFDGKVNIHLISYLYECKNKNKKIFLITKHDGNIKSSLKEFCIPENLFEEIYHIKHNEKKSNYIKDLSSIFIDNLYSERLEVSGKLNIPVFDVDAIDCLIDT